MREACGSSTGRNEIEVESIVWSVDVVFEEKGDCGLGMLDVSGGEKPEGGGRRRGVVLGGVR